MSKITFSKTWFGSLKINLFDKVDVLIGIKGDWGIGFEFSWHDRALVFELVKIYIIIEKHWPLLDESPKVAVD